MSSTRARTRSSVLRVALWCVLLAAVTRTTTDPDLWGNVRFGLDILRDGSVPHADPYSFTADRTWVNHEWLAEVVIGNAFRTAGAGGLVVFKVTAIGIMLLLLTRALRREGVRAPTLVDAAAAATIILTFDQIRYVRPQLLSLVAFAAVLSTLTAAQRGSQRVLLWLPPLFAVWANLHGGWLVGGGIFALWTLVTAVVGARRHALWCAAAGVASLAATLLTPYGPELWTFLRETVGFDRADIVEWQPIYVLGWESCLPWAATAAIAVAGVVAARAEGGFETRSSVERIVCVAVLAIASALVARLQAFFALSVFFLLVPALVRAYQSRTRVVRIVGNVRGVRRSNVTDPNVPNDSNGSNVPNAPNVPNDSNVPNDPNDPNDSNCGRAPWLPQVACAGVALAGLITAVTNVTQLRIDPRWTPEPAAVAFLTAQPADRRVLIWFDWGGYALWHLAPKMRISMDGRRETVYSPTLQNRHLRFYFDAPGGASLPADLAADYVWIPRTLPAVHRLESEGWTRLYQGEQSVVFGRPSLPSVANPVMLSAEAHSRFFPGP